MEHAPRVLVVDDDPQLLTSLGRALNHYGFEVLTAPDAGVAIESIADEDPDLIILDVVMPVVSGLQLCRLIRERVEAPILMLTGLDGVADRVAGLESGADDYLSKPFNVSELVARMRALLRRRRRGSTPENVLRYGDLVLDIDLWEVTRGGRPVSLTSKEFRVLQLFMEAPGHVYPREEILARVWGDEAVLESNVVDVHIAGLRRKLEAGGRRRLLHTVRAVGYVMRS
jgi:DNA-binding response OmpR family regulator